VLASWLNVTNCNCDSDGKVFLEPFVEGGVDVTVRHYGLFSNGDR
jgi:hypothetical protein